MFDNLFKHSFRALNRQKAYLLINVAGLTMGIASSLLIALFIFHELSYDQFNEKKDRIFRLVVHGIIGDREVSYAITSAPVGPTMLNEFPEVENYTRINTLNAPTIVYMDKKYTENGFIEADSTFFDLFSIPLLRGNNNTALNTPYSLVISQSTASKIFGNVDPMDKTLKVGKDEMSYTVTGIMADFPETSHFSANMIASFMTNPNSNDPYWGNNNYATYVLLKPNSKPEPVNAKMPGMIRRYMGDIAQQSLGISIDDFMAKYKYNIYLQPLREIHFDPSVTQMVNTKPASNRKYLYIFGCVAVLIILIAAINFMNLSTAQASRRAKEVGIKKVSGSSKGLLIRQFLTESILLSLASLLLAVIVIENSLPWFNNLLGIKLQMQLFGNWFMVPALLGLSLIIGLLAGSYPAFYLSSFNPYEVLKGKTRGKTKSGRLRSVLVVLQFSITIILIVGTIIMARQIRFMLNKDLGFNKEQLIVVNHAEAIGNHVKAFKDAVVKIPDVLMASTSTDVPGHSESGRTYGVEGRPGDVMDFRINFIDYDFFKTYGMSFASGRAFNESHAADKDAIIVNESTVSQMNLMNPLTMRLVNGNERIPIIGVVKNFHYQSLQTGINPYVFRLKTDDDNYGYISIRLSAKASAKTIREIEKVWDEFTVNDSFQFFFMDQDFAQKYKEEKQSARLSLIFSIMAIIIACLGLFGLMSFTIEQRTKEIGIRKSMGASVTGIFYLITREIILLVFVSTLISWPLIYYVANNWLKNYYYRINLRPYDFLLGFLVALTIALATVVFHAIKLSKTNPVEALRYE
jgi:putative ABC transport system permease protein